MLEGHGYKDDGNARSFMPWNGVSLTRETTRILQVNAKSHCVNATTWLLQINTKILRAEQNLPNECNEPSHCLCDRMG